MHPVKAPEERSLATAGGSYKGGNTLVVDGQVDILEGVDVSRIIEIEPLYFELHFVCHCLYLHFIRSLPVIVMKRMKSVITNEAAHAWACQSS